MEVSIFPKLSDLLKRFVEIRLHVDDIDATRAERFKNYQLSLVNNPAIPYYVIVDPQQPEKPKARFAGADLPWGTNFRKFLERYLAKNS